MGSLPTEAPNVGGVGKNAFFDWSRSRNFGCHPPRYVMYVTVVRVHDGVLSEEYIYSLFCIRQQHKNDKMIQEIKPNNNHTQIHTQTNRHSLKTTEARPNIKKQFLVAVAIN